MSAKKLIVVCGGTGGHFYPGLSVARAFKANGGDAKLFLVGKHAIKQSNIAEDSGVDSIILTCLPPPLGIIGKIKFLFMAFFRVTEATRYLTNEKPDFVLGMGSFYSVPALWAAKKLDIPIYLHDGNSFVGKANIFLSRFAQQMGLAFPPENAEKLKCPFVVTGMPLRPELGPEKIKKKFEGNIIAALNREFSIEFSEEKPVILVFGGSQGAVSFNKIIPEAFALMACEDIQIIHISGAGYLDEVKEIYRHIKTPHLIIDGTEDMGLLYAAADLVICRAGGSTVAELALFGKYAIMIPYPFATDNHQRFNAEYYTSLGCSIMIDNAELNSEAFAETLIDWFTKHNEFIQSAEKNKQLAHPRAAEEVIAMIYGKNMIPEE